MAIYEHLYTLMSIKSISPPIKPTFVCNHTCNINTLSGCFFFLHVSISHCYLRDESTRLTNYMFHKGRISCTATGLNSITLVLMYMYVHMY